MSDRIPSYPKKPHKRGYARISVNGRDIWLGRWNTPESRQKYARIIAELESVGAELEKQRAAPGVPTVVADLILAFHQYAEKRYVKRGKVTSEVQAFKAALGPVYDFYRDISPNDFGPVALMACRDELNRRGFVRKKVNQHMQRIRRVWKWGVARELVRVEVWQALTAVEGLRRGEGIDRPRIKPVAEAAVDALQGHVLPPVWAMIQLQRWTAMRPGEVVQMRTCDIVQNDPDLPKEIRGLCWAYRPASHKTEHHDRPRLILLGPQAQELLRAWLKPAEPEAYLFSSAEAVEYARATRAANAKVRRKGFTPKSKPKRAPRPFYDVSAYATAIERGCEKAFGLPAELSKWAISRVKDEAEKERRVLAAREWRQQHCWAPNQLRHNAATWIRENYDREVARIVLGHVDGKTTDIYAEEDVKKAAKAMATIG
jgi:integrase